MSTPTASQSRLAQWAPLVTVSLAMFVVVLDSTMMNVAVPTIARDLKTDVSAVQAAVSLYSMVMASLMLTGGKLGDIYGGKRMFAIGLAVYGVGTLLAAASWNIGVLILGWSVIEGIAAALIMPLGMVLLFANYSGRDRAIAFGVFGGVQASGAAVGPILGGFLTEFASWRWGFGLQVIIVLLAFPFVRYMRESARDRTQQLDWLGTVLSTLGLSCIVVGFLLAGQYGWWLPKRPFEVAGMRVDLLGLAPTPVLIGLGVAVLLGFAHWQHRRAQQGRTPLLRLGLLANVGFMSIISMDLVRQLMIAGFLFVLPLYLQSVLGFNALDSGVALLSFSAATFVLSMTTANLADRVPPKYLIQLGLVFMTGGLVYLWAITDATMTLADFVLPGAIIGIGLGLLVAQVVNLAISRVAADERNEAAGTHNTFRELGGSLGTAVIGSIFLTGVYVGFAGGILRADQVEASPTQRQEVAVQLENDWTSLSAEQREQVIGQLPPEQQQELERIAVSAAVDSQRNALLVLAGSTLLALGIATFIPRSAPRREEKVEPGPKSALR